MNGSFYPHNLVCIANQIAIIMRLLGWLVKRGVCGFFEWLLLEVGAECGFQILRSQKRDRRHPAAEGRERANGRHLSVSSLGIKLLELRVQRCNDGTGISGNDGQESSG